MNLGFKLGLGRFCPSFLSGVIGLHEVASALRFGPKFRSYLGLIYNNEAPPVRRVKINGGYGDYFPLYSGVPQGDPCSPILFLFITLKGSPGSSWMIIRGSRELRLTELISGLVSLLMIP